MCWVSFLDPIEAVSISLLELFRKLKGHGISVAGCIVNYKDPALKGIIYESSECAKLHVSR